MTAPELVAPAGDWNCLRAAVANGADCVYFGLSCFNARMRAENFREEELPGVVDFLHKAGAFTKSPETGSSSGEANWIFQRLSLGPGSGKPATRRSTAG